MNSLKYIYGILLTIVVLFGCNNEEWNDHYTTSLETVNMNVWDAIKQDSNLSIFDSLISKYHYDTLFTNDHIYTLFIPTNAAFSQYIDSEDKTKAFLDYNISEFFILSESVRGLRKIQTLGEKYALLYKSGSTLLFDNIPLIFESPLYLNGKYFIMDTIAYPKYNLYEYFSIYNPVLKAYIDSKDSLILDKEKSRPIGFDANGNTIYDTVAIKYNLFEEEYFPVKHESRYKTATIVFPKSDDYNNALTEMAKKLNYTDYRDIPMIWQEKYLIPYLLKHGVFENLLDEDDFVLDPLKNDTLRLKNILGDSVDIKYKPSQKTLCSNGYAYNYENFKIADTLWNTTNRFEAEHLLRNTGADRWEWKDGITVNYTTNFAPKQSYFQKIASKDSFLSVTYTTTYKDVFSVEFNIDNLFPRKYLMVIRTNSTLGGKYNIYVNGTFVKTIDYYNFVKGYYDSPESKIRYFRDSQRIFISFDCWIDQLLTQYGKCKIKFEYKGISTLVKPGLSIDYIDFKPY